jgi:DNA repair protein SbcC/Rad50
MRLYRLRMTAIGPFADPVELDLTRLGSSGLFLIEGRTGAGKSTILDAISFALYGKLARGSAGAERLKSHHCDPGVEPVVELVFETQRGRYRIRRTPTHDRPKKKGAGSTRATMTVKLFRLTDPDDLDGGELISNNLGDAEDEITRAVGLSHGQFLQTVLLPQGDFAAFLQAGTNDKRLLLQRLFGTELIARTQQLLEQGRTAAVARRAEAERAVHNAVHAFAGVAGLTEDATTALIALAESTEPAALAAATAAAQQVLREQLAEATGALAERRASRQAAERQLAAETELAERRRLREELRTERDQLIEGGPAAQLARAELAAAERAAGVRPAAEGVKAAIGTLDRVRAAELALRSGLPAELAEADEAELREQASRLAELLGELTGQLDREQQLAEHRAELAEVAAERAEQAELVQAAERQLAELPAEQAALTAEQAGAAAAADRLAGLQAERNRAEQRLLAARQAELAATEAAMAKKLLQQLFDDATVAQRQFEVLQQRWRANIASELGLALQDGDPCAVCGSVEHPRPARRRPDAVSQDQVQQAERRSRSLSADLERRRQQLLEQQTALLQLQAEADRLTPELAAATLDKATAAVEQARLAADRLSGLQARLAALAERGRQLTDGLAAARTLAGQLAERAEGLDRTITADEKNLIWARDGYPTVAARQADLQRLLRATERVAAAAGETGRAGTAAEAAGAIFTGALAEAGFADERSWQRALRPPAAVRELRDRIARYDDRLSAVAGRLAAPELVDPALDQLPADLTAVAELAEQAQTEEHAAAQAHGAARHRVDRAAALAGTLDRAVQACTEVLRQTAAAIRLGNLVAGLGENRLRMELTSYLLVRRYAEVLDAANSQLRRISQGRYQLEHTDERTGAGKAGLNLRVLDLHTGRPRDPATLSGGETFYVSLALALGLADVVRAESGGIDLGTLFIDEGFGTLDAEVLDEVIDVLDSLRTGGRVVGIVSHVSELKLRIADQIKVIPSPTGGSRVQLTA